MRPRILLVGLVSLLPLIVAAAPQKKVSDQRLMREFRNLQQAYFKAMADYYKPLEMAKSDSERAKIKLDPAKDPAHQYLPKVEALAKRVLGNQVVGPLAESTVIDVASGNDQKACRLALDHLTGIYVQAPTLDRYFNSIVKASNEVHGWNTPAATKALTSTFMLIEARARRRTVKAAALVRLGEVLGIPQGPSKLDLPSAKRILARAIRLYHDTPSAGQARNDLFEIDHLQVGMTAPDFEVEDENGVKWKLSDQRGRVVLLDFWGFWCNHCREMLPQEKELVLRLKDKPFTLLGLNSDGKQAEVAKMLKEQGITWRQGILGFTNAPLPKMWNVKTWPATYIIDQKGIIRYRDLRGGEMEQAIDKLLNEMNGVK